MECLSVEQIRVIEKTATGLKIFLTEQDGKASVGKWMTSFVKSQPANEFQHSRDYIPALPTDVSLEVATDVIAAAFAKVIWHASVTDTCGEPVHLRLRTILAFFGALRVQAAQLLNSNAKDSEKFAVPNVITTTDRKKILSDRKEAERLEKERLEREAASEELRKVHHGTRDCRWYDSMSASALCSSFPSNAHATGARARARARAYA